jgi:hypothetical protein
MASNSFVVGDLAMKTVAVEPVDVTQGDELDVVQSLPRVLGDRSTPT